MNENENLQPVQKLTPFTKMVMSIGTLPSSFYASMSYYESMVWLYEYLKNTIIPTVNNNAEAVEELQGKYLEFTAGINEEVTDFKSYINGKVDELETYMNNYFTNLDVQEEINTKLDAMAENGTLTNLIKAYIDPLYQAYETQINGEMTTFKTGVNNQISNLSSLVNSAVSGSPLVASSTTGMIDTTRVYVNTSDGYWYYYNGSSWTQGGVYQSAGLNESVFGINPELVDGYIGSTGILAPASDVTAEKTTVPINVIADSKINFQQSFSESRSLWIAVCYYTGTTFISRDVLKNESGTTYNGTVTIPSGCDNIRFSFRTFNLEGTYTITDLSNYNDVYNYLSKPVKYPDKYPTAIIGGRGYVTLDTTFLTLTIPQDTMIINRNVNNNPATNYYVIDSTKVVDISSTGEASSAINVYFDQTTHEFVLGAYNTYSADINNYILFCTIRRSIDTSIYPFTISGNFPYLIDGNKDNVIDYSNNNIKMIAHRGYSQYAPENTIPAYQMARKYGFRYVETDVSFTSDGYAVLLHDGSIDRTSNGTGNINELTYAQVSEYDFGSWKNAIFTGTKIPLFSDFIKCCKRLGLHPYIEIKDTAVYTQEQVESLVDIVNANGMRKNVTWISFSQIYLNYVKQYDEEARLGYTVNSITSTTIEIAQSLKTSKNEVFIDASVNGIENLSLAIAELIPVEVWTVDNPSTIINLDPYITGITTNYQNVDKILYHEAI